MERELLDLTQTEEEDAALVPPVIASAESGSAHLWESEELPPLPAFPPVPRCPHVLKHPFSALGWMLKNGMGIVTLIVFWAVVAAIPIVQILALGYLLEVQGRVARTGRLRDAFPMLELAPRLGSIVLGVGFWLLPLMFVASYASDAQLIDPESSQAANWKTARIVLSIGVILHLCLALARGGSFFCFFRPLKNLLYFIKQIRSQETDYWDTAERNVREFTARWRLGHLFSLGFRGLIGAFAWLAIPTLLFSAANKPEGPAILVTVLGGLLLVLVFSWLPFLQSRFAAENRLGAFFEPRTIREAFGRAPLAFTITMLGVYALSLPLYLSKVALPPRDALMLLTPLFIISIYPAKVLAGWAYHRSTKREDRVKFRWRLLARLAMAPTLVIYVFLLYLTQFIGAQGKFVLFQHHAFLLPVPF